MSGNILRGALLATTGILCAAVAQAQTNYVIGSGPAKIVGGGSTLATPTYIQILKSFANSSTTYTYDYTGKGSGASQCAFANNDGTAFDGSLPAGSSDDLAASDAYLTQTQLNSYNMGQAAGMPTTCASSAENNSTVVTETYPAMGILPVSGPLIQLPTFGTPITIPFSSTTAINNGNSFDGGITLTDDQLCGIFSGKIVNFNDPLLAGSGLQFQGPNSDGSGQINVVYRSDGSGTSFLFTQHLAQVCTNANATASFVTALASYKTAKNGTTSFSSLFTNGLPAGEPAGSSFVPGNGSGGVLSALGGDLTGKANGLNGNVYAIGYLTPDYTDLPAVNASNSDLPPVAALINAADGNAYLPDFNGTSVGLTYATPVVTPFTPSNPLTWIKAVATPASGYPIVGYTTIEVSQCYASSSVAAGVIAFLSNLYNGLASTNTLLANGFVGLGTTDRTNINRYILGNLAKPAANLDIEDPNVCKGAVGATSNATYAGR